MMESSTALNSICYLDELSNRLEVFSLPDVLRSYYLTKARINILKESVPLPNKAIDPAIRCPRCCTLHVNNNTSYTIQAKRKLSRSKRGLLKKQEAEEKKRSTYIISCGQCHKEIKFAIDEQKPHSMLETSLFTPSLLKPSLLKKSLKSGKKKKKNKDKTAGLNLSFQTVNSSVPLNKSAPEKNNVSHPEESNLQLPPNIVNTTFIKNTKKNKKVDFVLLRKENERNLAITLKNKQQAKGKMNKISNALNKSNSNKRKKNSSGNLRLFLQSM